MGLGCAFTSLNKTFQDELFTKGETDREFAMGLVMGFGIGLGKNFAYVRKSFEFRIFTQALVNTQFAIGLGEGLGYVFSLLDNEL
jgi:hypothetical protein